MATDPQWNQVGRSQGVEAFGGEKKTFPFAEQHFFIFGWHENEKKRCSAHDGHEEAANEGDEGHEEKGSNERKGNRLNGFAFFIFISFHFHFISFSFSFQFLFSSFSFFITFHFIFNGFDLN